MGAVLNERHEVDRIFLDGRCVVHVMEARGGLVAGSAADVSVSFAVAEELGEQARRGLAARRFAQFLDLKQASAHLSLLVGRLDLRNRPAIGYAGAVDQTLHGDHAKPHPSGRGVPSEQRPTVFGKRLLNLSKALRTSCGRAKKKHGGGLAASTHS
jgi:hypothetical protein